MRRSIRNPRGAARLRWGALPVKLGAPGRPLCCAHGNGPTRGLAGIDRSPAAN